MQCPACQSEVPVKSQQFLEEARDAKCRSHHKFNEFAVYEDLYNNFPLARNIVDKIAKAVYSRYHLERNDTSSSEIERIEKWFSDHQFGQLLSQITLDSVKFGNCLLYFEGKDLRRVNLPETSFSVSTGVSSIPFSSVTYRNKRIEYSEIIQLKNEKESALSSSCFGGWLESFYAMKIALETLHNSGRNGQMSRLLTHNTAKVCDFHEDRLLEYGEKQTSKPLILSRRSEIERLVTRKIFPVILGRDANSEPFPSLMLE